MKFGCTGTPEDIPTIRQAGYDYIEMSCKQLLALPPAQLLRAAAALEKNGLPCKALNAYCPKELVIAGEGFQPKAARAYAKKAALLAQQLGVSHVGIGSPYSRILPAGFPRETADAQAVQFFTVTAEEFGTRGVFVGIEALGRCYCNYINLLAEAVALAKKINNPWLGVCLDFYNMEQNGEADCPLDFAGPWVRHAHISDDAGGPLKRYFFKKEKAPAHERRLRALAALGFRGAVSLEVDLPVQPAPAADSLALLRRTLTNK